MANTALTAGAGTVRHYSEGICGQGTESRLTLFELKDL